MVINLQNQLDSDRPFNMMAWGHWFTFANLLLALVISFFYIASEPLPVSFMGYTYLLVSWVGHFSFLCLACFIISIFPVIHLFPYKRHIRGVAASIATLLQMYLFLDVLTYRGLGYHLSSSSIHQLKKVEDVYLAQFDDIYWIILLLVLFALMAFQFTVSNLCWKRIDWLQSLKYKNKIAPVLLSAFIASHGIYIWADATLNTDIAKQSSMFPASYPMTAKTLLAKYDLIDITEYRQGHSEQVSLNRESSQGFVIKMPKLGLCDATNTPNLSVAFVPSRNQKRVTEWLKNNNVDYQGSHMLNLPLDMDTAIFNFTSGLPGLYADAENIEYTSINAILAQDKIAVTVQNSDFAENQAYADTKTKRVFIFYEPNQNQHFYRTRAILVGFSELPDTAFNPQNIVASYISEVLDCKEFVKQNMIDVAISQIKSDVLTNYSEGYLNLIYKDKAMLFHKGQLISNQSFSTGEKVSEPLDLNSVQEAIAKITEKRVK